MPAITALGRAAGGDIDDAVRKLALR